MARLILWWVLCVFALVAMPHLGMAQNFDVDLDKNPMADPPAGDALNQDRPGAPWITKWYAPEGPLTNNGGFAVSAPKDWIDTGTKGKLTQASLSTSIGLQKTRDTDLDWGNNGGKLGWTVIEINPANGNNMSTAYGLPASDNFDTYAIIVIESPNNRNAIMSPAHDDHAQIWINGKKVYNNSAWTGAATQVDFDVEVELQRGGNVLLYRCGESGGSDYFNLHFDDKTTNEVGILPDKANDQGTFFSELAGLLSVEPFDKLATTWADIKRK